MLRPETPKFLVNFNKVTATTEVPGLLLRSRELPNGVLADVIVTKGMKIKAPIHLCFGVTREEGIQEIISRFIVEDEAEALILAHCSFPRARDLIHRMEAQVIVGRDAKFFYEERHYHGLHSGAKVYPVFQVDIGPRSRFQTIFSLTQGTVGELVILLDAYAYAEARVEAIAKVHGRSSKDRVRIRDGLFLEGRDARGVIRLRAAATNGGDVLMQGITEANAPGATGHVDCKEIVQGFGSTARAIPIVRVTDDRARVTHEAAVGRVNQKELDTLMARGLTEQEAVDMIVAGML